MPDCDLCGKEVNFLFRCSHCHKAFCSEHRLPESHECVAFDNARVPFSAPRIRESTVTTKGWKCPKCGVFEEDCFSFDAETMTFKCYACGNKWTQMKATGEYVALRDPSASNETQTAEKPKKKHWFF